MWVYGHTRLSDYYSGHISFRELFNRIMALPRHAPLWDIADAAAEREKHDALIDALLSLDDRFKPKEG